MANYFSITLKEPEHDVNHAKEVLTKMNDISEEAFNFDGARMVMFIEKKSDKDNWAHLQGFLRLNKKTTEPNAVKWLNTKGITKASYDPCYLETTRNVQEYFKYIMNAGTKVPGDFFVYHGEFKPHGGNRKRKLPRTDYDAPKQVTGEMLIDYYKNGDYLFDILDTFGSHYPKDHERLRLMVQKERLEKAWMEKKERLEKDWVRSWTEFDEIPKTSYEQCLNIELYTLNETLLCKYAKYFI